MFSVFLVRPFLICVALFDFIYSFARLEVTKLTMPKTVTCHILSADMLKVLSYSLQRKDDSEQSNLIDQVAIEHTHGTFEGKVPPPPEGGKCPLLLAGLHACGDLSVSMLR